MAGSGSIPFSTFVDVTTSTVAPAATFGRLNALVVTNSATGELFKEFKTAQEVIAYYGVGSPQAQYATTFFGYSSKTATKPQKLTFYNWHQTPVPYRYYSGTLPTFEKFTGDTMCHVTIDDVSSAIVFNLVDAVNYTDIADMMTQSLQEKYPAAGVTVTYDEALERLVFSLTYANKISFTEDTVETFDIFEGNITSRAVHPPTVYTFKEPATLNIEAGDITGPNTTVTATETLQVLYLNGSGDTVPLFTREIEQDTTLPIQFGTDSTDVSAGTAIDNIKLDKTGWTIKNAKMTAVERNFVDLVVKFKLLPAFGAYEVQKINATTLQEAVNEICLANGDYVTLSYDNTISINRNITGDLMGVLNVMNGYPLSRYYFVACVSDAYIETAIADGSWDSVMATEGLIATRVPDGKNTYINAYVQAVIASIDFGVANGATNVNFIDAAGFEDDAIVTAADLTKCNDRRVNTVYITGGYGQTIPLYGEGHIMGNTFKTLSVALGETYIKAQMQVQGITILTGSNLISLRGKAGQGQVLAVFSAIMQAATVSGIIVQGVTLTPTESSTIVQLTGIPDIASLVATNGWYVQIDTITDEHIANKAIPITIVYVANTPTNRIQVRSFVIGA